MDDKASGSEERGKRKERAGVVISAAPNKTAVVQVNRRAPHPLYGKVLTQRKKYYAHDEQNEARKGDHVSIVETRPYSKTKRWRISAIRKRAAGQ